MKFIYVSILAIMCSLMLGLLPDLFRHDIRKNNIRNSQAFVLEADDNMNIDGFVTVKNFKIPVYLAKNEAERIKGLSDSRSINKKYGMFFVFENSEYQSMWMKNMLFSIDIIWIDEDYRIVHMEKNISPDTYPKIFTAPIKARFVLELKAGMGKYYNLLVGDLISLELK